MADIKIKRALIAVYDKTGIADFAKALVEEFGIEIISKVPPLLHTPLRCNGKRSMEVSSTSKRSWEDQ